MFRSNHGKTYYFLCLLKIYINTNIKYYFYVLMYIKWSYLTWHDNASHRSHSLTKTLVPEQGHLSLSCKSVSPKDPWNNKGYCYCPWWFYITWRWCCISEDITYFSTRAWMNQASTDLEVSFLKNNSHSVRRSYAKYQEKEVVNV